MIFEAFTVDWPSAKFSSSKFHWLAKLWLASSIWEQDTREWLYIWHFQGMMAHFNLTCCSHCMRHYLSWKWLPPLAQSANYTFQSIQCDKLHYVWPQQYIVIYQFWYNKQPQMLLEVMCGMFASHIACTCNKLDLIIKITKSIKFEGLVILTNKNAKYWCSKFTYLEELHSQLASHAYSDTVLYNWNALRTVLFEVKQIFWVFNLWFNFQGYALGWQQISIIMLNAILRALCNDHDTASYSSSVYLSFLLGLHTSPIRSLTCKHNSCYSFTQPVILPFYCGLQLQAFITDISYIITIYRYIATNLWLVDLYSDQYCRGSYL